MPVEQPTNRRRLVAGDDSGRDEEAAVARDRAGRIGRAAVENAPPLARQQIGEFGGEALHGAHTIRRLGQWIARPERSSIRPPSTGGIRLTTQPTPGGSADRPHERLAFILIFVTPALFITNMLVARATADFIPPVALAFWRWVGAFILLLPFAGRALWQARRAIRREWLDLLILGGLGMGVCGAFVYIGAATTTATNIGLIYAASPVLIILLDRSIYGATMSTRQGAGVALALIGVLAIIARGDPDVFINLRFTAGDLWIAAAAVAWAFYSIMLRHRPSAFSMAARFAAIAAGGLVTLAPFAAVEAWSGRTPALDATTIGTIVFLAFVPSVGAYYCYALVQRTLGASRTGLLMYLGPVYNAGLAWLLLGETLRDYHLAGAALILPGLYLATQRAKAGKLPPA
ncbi:MAG: DMT family transporter [Rhodospirillales bacterium]|nr:DMT family transporter [Rhodospirillales bacterium]